MPPAGAPTDRANRQQRHGDNGQSQREERRVAEKGSAGTGKAVAMAISFAPAWFRTTVPTNA